jgi:hypothetical protein
VNVGEFGFTKGFLRQRGQVFACAGGLLSSKCYSVGPNFLEEAHVSNLVVFISMSAIEPCHIV